MSSIFTPEQIEQLSNEIDSQLKEIKTHQTALYKGDKSIETLAKQTEIVAQITQEKPETFLKKFAWAAKQDLCEEGGVLNKQWKRWADLSNKDVIDKFGAVLVGLGFTGNTLNILLVAVAVIVVHIGVKAFCEDYSE